MIGLEVVAVIAAISTAFTRGLDFLQNRKARKASKSAKETQLQNTEVVLRASGPAIRSQFERCRSQIGPRFAVGDGMFFCSVVRIAGLLANRTANRYCTS
jgi:hypothetical protein